MALRNAASKVLIVGCGLTGALTANLISRHEKNIEIHIWEKEKSIGGRMCTAVSPSTQCCLADLGAQYITATPDYVRNHAQFYEELLEANILQPLKGKIEGLRKQKSGTLNFSAPNGIGSIVKHYLKNEKDFIVSLNEQLVKLELDEGKTQWVAISSSGKTDSFDAVILTIPAPQIVSLEGKINSMLDSDAAIKSNLEKVKYSSRYALALFYDTAQEYFQKLPWIAKYFAQHNVIRFIAIDNMKRGNPNNLPSLVAHSSIDFGDEQQKEDAKNAQNLMLSTLQEILPDLPQPSHMKCHKWNYSQVTTPYPEAQGCLVINDIPLLICGGDAFSKSTFDGCIDSAIKIVEETLKHL